MKKFCWLMIVALFSSALLAQEPAKKSQAPAIDTPAAAPAVTNAGPTAVGSTNETAAQTEKKKSTKKKLAKTAGHKKEAVQPLRSVPLTAGPAVVVARVVNVRGKAGLRGEVIGHVTNGEPVTVLEEVTLKKSAADEPSAWAKILLPASIHVWVNSSFIDTNKTVRPKKLNARGGPGENYSVLGTLKQGDAVKDLNTKGEWLEIEAPSDAFAFVAAQYLKQEAPAEVAAATPPTTEPATPSPTPVTVPEPAPAAPAPATTPTPPPAETPTTPQVTDPAASTNTTVSNPAPAVEEPPPKRIVQREGIVKGTFSIQAPTPFELVSPDNGRTINYLHTEARDLDLRRWKGLRVIVTGEEGLDERWRNTPVITLQRIQVIE